MQGIVLGFNEKLNEGVIVADEKRYKFETNDWKESFSPKKGAKVDFIVEGEKAKEIYLIDTSKEENSLMILGVISLFITFFFGFIGTAISRMAISKQSFSDAIGAIAIHAVITILGLLVPAFGVLIYLVGTIYYMVQNYKLIIKPAPFNKYESR